MIISIINYNENDLGTIVMLYIINVLVSGILGIACLSSPDQKAEVV